MNVILLSGPSIYGSFEKLTTRDLHRQLIVMRDLIDGLETFPALKDNKIDGMWTGSTGYVAKMGLAAAKVLRSRRVPYDRLGMDPVAYFTRKCEAHAKEQAAPKWLLEAIEKHDCAYFRSVREHLVHEHPEWYGKLFRDEKPFFGFDLPEAS